jgi:hypothetical protein
VRKNVNCRTHEHRHFERILRVNGFHSPSHGSRPVNKMEAGGFALDAAVSETSTHYKAIAVLRSFARASLQSLAGMNDRNEGWANGLVESDSAGQGSRRGKSTAVLSMEIHLTAA